MSDTMQITTIPEKNLLAALAGKMTDIMAVAAPNVRADGNWLTRTKLELLAKPDVAGLMNTKKGIETALTAIIRAATVGINFGGTHPQAYFVPSDGGIRLDVSQYGFCAAAVYGPGAVLAQIPELVTVHQNDGIRVDQANGRIIYPAGGIDPFGDRGKLVGWMMKLDYKDGRQSEVRYIDFAKVRQIEDQHGNVNSPAYKKDRDQMDEKTAVKQMLKRVFAEAEGRSQMNMESLMGDEEPVIERDQGKRLADRLERAAEGMKAAEVVEPEPVQVGIKPPRPVIAPHKEDTPETPADATTDATEDAQTYPEELF